MLKKVALNIFLTIGIVVLIFGVSWSFKHNNYVFAIAGILSIGVLLYLKVRLIKTVRKMTNKP